MGISVTNATEILIIIATETTYNGFDNEFKDISQTIAIVNKRVSNATDLGYEALYKRHIDDYNALYSRVDFSLGDESQDEVPTDERIDNMNAGNLDIGLVAMYFQYGRYLLISSSRENSQAANLQGIWNYEIRPPWSSNYTTNINAQMNYWLAENCNLAECHLPLIDMIKELSIEGKIVAQEHYGCNGWTTSHNVDLWRNAAPVGGNANYAYWPMGSGWLCEHIYEHYNFNPNIDFLKEIYPIIKQSAMFYKDWLTQDESGYLVTSPATSPENTFITPYGGKSSVSKATTMDMTIIREVFNTCIEFSQLLDIDKEFTDTLIKMRTKLFPYQIGQYGQLQEWYMDFNEHEIGHRHVSHLYGLYPGNIITEDTPKLFEACKKSLLRRLANGGGHTGWSCAWIINLFARLKDGETAGKYVNTLLTRSIYPNMFDAHPPFQIDGNFGGTAGICEMLLQSHRDYIELLPALPVAWHTGAICGIKARGNYEVSIEWSDSKLTQFEIKSSENKEIKVKYNDIIINAMTNECIKI